MVVKDYHVVLVDAMMSSASLSSRSSSLANSASTASLSHSPGNAASSVLGVSVISGIIVVFKVGCGGGI